MGRIGYGVVIKSQAQVNDKMRPNCPLISAKPRKLVLVDDKSGRRSKFDSVKCRSCNTDNIHREELLAAVVRATGEIEASLQLVVTVKMLRAGLVGLLPLNAICVAILPVKKSTLCRLD